MEAYWKWLIETDHKASQAYDKAVMTLSGGALAVSLAFIKDIIKSPTPNSLLALEFAWGCLAFSIVAILFSMLSSQWALRRAMKQVEQQTIQKCRPGGWLSKLTAVLNVLAGLGFIAGVILLAIFSITNMKSASKAPFL